MTGALPAGEPFSVEVEGARLSGEARGAGTPLVLVHGMAGDRHEWDRLLAALPPGLATLRYDLRGFGQSHSALDREHSHADDLLALFDVRGIARAPLLGLSMGGGVALNFALSHPERVSRLILVSPAVVGWDWSDAWKARMREVKHAARSGDMPRARELWLAHPMFATLAGDLAVELRRSIDAYHGGQWLRDPQRPELPDVDRLHTLAVPTLLLTGDGDVDELRLIADVIAAGAPDVTRIDYPAAGHMLHLERTAAVAEAVAAFVS
jgi:2-succinyl-6-hydroxy-2,4-cyclohexadiene-1-carboxylate synthase